MRKFNVYWVSAIALVGATGCGSSGGGGGGNGGELTSTIDLRVDNNRNGVIDLDDPTEDLNEEEWGVANGAVFLPNIDDDEGKCPKGPDASSVPDVDLAACHDGNNEVIDGPDDLADLARIVVKPWPQAPDNASGQVWIADPAPAFVRVFRNVQGNWQAVQLPTFLNADDIRNGVELAIEGKDVLRDLGQWDGMVTAQLDVDGGTSADGRAYPDGSDVVKLRLAPLTLMHHLQKAEQIFVTALNISAGSAAFRQDLSAAANQAGVPQGMHESFVSDQWTQDWMELAHLTMPGPGGVPHRIDVFMRSVNTTSSQQQPLRQAGDEVYASFHGKDTAGFTPPWDPKHSGQMDSLNSYGNTETIPPYEHNGESYPLGRVFRGSVPSFYPDTAMQKMLDAQQVQPGLNVDTSWLLVGHVDETISFVKMNNPRGWGMAVNDVPLAKKMLEDLVSGGNGAVTMFKGKSWWDDNNQQVPAEISVQDVLADTDVMGESSKAVTEVDAQLDVFKAQVGITDQDLIPMPFLHYPSYGFSLAYQPGTVNGIYLSDTVFGAPRPHGPIVGGVDVFEKQLNEAMAAHGITVAYIEDWDLYHRLSGEVHCGSNTKRALSATNWWESGK